jgi:hypothetical protein
MLSVWDENTGAENGPVSEVDPADLKNVWIMCCSASAPAKNRAIGFPAVQQVCRPGVDARAVWYRAAILELMCRQTTLLAPWFRNGDLEDKVFKIAATFRIEELPAGAVHQGFPLDTAAFIGRIKAEIDAV